VKKLPDLFSRPIDIEWEEGALAPLSRHRHTAALCNGVIYVGGGWTKNDVGKVQYPHTLDMYHLNTNIWETIDTPHESFAIAVLTGKVLIVGGTTKMYHVTNKVLVLESGQWRDYTEMASKRRNATAVSHQSMMIVMGGVAGSHTSCTTELFDDITGQWFKSGDLPQPLSYLHSVIVGNKLFVLGGRNAEGKLSTAMYAAPLDTLSNRQVKWEHLVDTPCNGPAAFGLNNQYLLTVGEKSIYILNSVANAWENIATLPEHAMNTAVVCEDISRLVIIGGLGTNRLSTNKVWIGLLQ